MSAQEEPIMSRRLTDCTLGELITRFDETQAQINANDGRFSTGSSAQLDYDMEQQEDVAREIAHRLGLYDRLHRLENDHTIRLQNIERRLRLGSSRNGDFEFLDGYISIAPPHCWYEELMFGLINPLRRGERPRWIRWEGGAWIFKNDRVSRGAPGFEAGGRWGFGVLGIEIGSRDPRDPLGCWLKDHGLWPW